MAFLIPRSIACALENNKLDFEKGKEYECIRGYYMQSNGFEFTKGRVYKCTENYYIPCNNGRQISQFSLIGTEHMFRVKK
jgi:hypothetical protein